MPDEAPALDDVTFGHAFVSRWIAGSLDVTPLSDADRREVEAGLAMLHEGVGRPWHGNVVWARSPQEFTRLLADAPARMRGPYLASLGRTGPVLRAIRATKALSQGTLVVSYAIIAAVIAFIPSYYAGSLVDTISGHQLDRGGLLAVVLLTTLLTGLFAATALSRQAVNAARRVFAPIGEDLDQRLRPILSRGRPGLFDVGEP